MTDEWRENEDLRLGYLLSWVLTGTEEGAGKSVADAIKEVGEHPAAHDNHKRRQLFFSAVRRRSLRFPALCKLPEELRELHRSPEPGRSVVVLQSLLGGTSASDVVRLLGLESRGGGEAAKQLKEALSSPDSHSEGFEGLAPAPSGECLAAMALYLKGSEHSAVKNPATFAVGAAFLILVGVVVWQVSGKAGVFPEEAIKVATEARRATQESFSPMDAKVSTLPDWFAMQGFEGFLIPPGLENLNAVGVRTFTFEGAPVAQVAVLNDEKNLYLMSFPAEALEIRNLRSQAWQVSSSGRYAFAIREENGMCFLVTFVGSEAEMKTFLAPGARN
jgi:hypothetical protein